MSKGPVTDGLSAERLFNKFEGESISYSDLILLPGFIDFPTNEVSLSGRLTKNITLNVPFVSAPMDTVTEAKMAISMALMGGLGIIHCNNTIEEQATHVTTVKRYCNGFITHPVCVHPDQPVSDVVELLSQFHFSGFPVVVRDTWILIGMISRRDIDLIENPSTVLVKNAMRTDVITGTDIMSLEEVYELIKAKSISRLPIVNNMGQLTSLVCRRDIRELRVHPLATRDPTTKKLLVGASVTTHARDMARVDALVAAGVDVIVIDSAQGHSKYTETCFGENLC
jgi:IMP dehydrogenase